MNTDDLFDDVKKNEANDKEPDPEKILEAKKKQPLMNNLMLLKKAVLQYQKGHASNLLERAQKTEHLAQHEFKERLKALNCSLLQEQIDTLIKEFKQSQDPQIWTQIVSLKQELEKAQEVA